MYTVRQIYLARSIIHADQMLGQQAAASSAAAVLSLSSYNDIINHFYLFCHLRVVGIQIFLEYLKHIIQAICIKIL